MVRITIQSDDNWRLRGVRLTEADEDGDYGWTCLDCHKEAESVQPIADAIAHAEIHVDLQCERLK